MSRDGSEWDYINEHMGGHDEDGLPNFMSKPGFADDSFHEKKYPDYFETFQDATAWAKCNPGRGVIRSPDGNGYIARLEVNAVSDSLQARLDKFSKEVQDWHKTLDKPLEKSDYYDSPNAEVQLPKAKLIRLKSVPVPKGVERKLRENYEVTSKHEWFEMIWGISQYKKYNIPACNIKSVGISHADRCWAVSKGKHGQNLVYLIENPERFFIFPTAQDFEEPK